MTLRRLAAFSSEAPKDGLLAKPESKVFFESVAATVKGFLNNNYVEESEPNLTAEEKSKMKRFLVYRFNPEDPNDKPRYVSYYIDLKKIAPMYLDVLFYIKERFDPTLSFRRSCREGICGSCAMNCDGLHSLACIRAIDTDLTKASLITPLGHMFVLKDLVVDMTNFYSQYKTIEPYLKRKHVKPPGVPLMSFIDHGVSAKPRGPKEAGRTLRVRPVRLLLHLLP
jgi:succinate dehydrogenase (ubiquinone) iron-sulfur subunit